MNPEPMDSDILDNGALVQDFGPRLVAWQKTRGRHDLPWQVADPYAVWVSEIMLQQTQVETVIPYYLRFMARFPRLADLADAGEEEVLACWSGLGYYARGRNLHKAARKIVRERGGVFPSVLADIADLPGVGRSTAAAIAVFAWGQRHAILDGNVKRVLCRLFGVPGWPGAPRVEARLWQLAEALLPVTEVGAYTQGLMDLGATLCRRTRPDCDACPFRTECVARREGRQASLPEARPRKATPIRTVRMFILIQAGAVLLERRPPTGIWGGLWSLPETPADSTVEVALAGLGFPTGAFSDWVQCPPLRHAFSHFKLDIQPVRVTLSGRSMGVAEPGRVWLDLEDALGAALPAPVRTLLARLVDQGL